MLPLRSVIDFDVDKDDPGDSDNVSVRSFCFCDRGRLIEFMS